MKIPFKKYHGLGNDFILIDGRDVPTSLDTRKIHTWCDRHRGIGADGILILEAGHQVPYRMVLYNSDGSPAEISGNGLRCFLLFLRDIGEQVSGPIQIETATEIVKAEIVDGGHVRVQMPRPVFGPSRDSKLTGDSTQRLKANDLAFDCLMLSLSNPHCVIFGPARDETFVKTYGPLIEKHTLFPKGANVEFAHILNDVHCQLTVWERGAGLTQACGSGATATVVAGVALTKLRANESVTVSQPGGDLQIIVEEDFSRVTLEGPAQFVFAGEIII